MLFKMSQTLFDDLEEGEIADEIIPEPVIVKKEKALPRRYILNDKVKTKHKKNCRHAPPHHKRKSCKGDFHFKARGHKKHHKVCSKHINDKYLKLSLKKNHYNEGELVGGNLMNRESRSCSSKLSLATSAFKNYTSPPRKISKVGSLKTSPSKVEKNYPGLLLKYKNSRSEFSKFKNISNLKDTKPSTPVSNDKNENVFQKQKSSENIPPVEADKPTSDDEDVEELRRIALATCSKRSPSNQEDTMNDICSKTNQSTSDSSIAATDNYEIVDMDVDNDGDKLETSSDLFIIDTTPNYLCNPESSLPGIDHNYSNIIERNVIQGNGFLPPLNINNTFQNVSNEVFYQNINNDLYTNFETPIENCQFPSSQLDDEFEEELLRAELIANIKSMRQKSKCSLNEQNVSEEVKSVSIINQGPKREVIVNEGRTVVLNGETQNCKVIHSSNERIVSIGNSLPKNNCSQKEERTVSLVGDIPFIDKTKKISSYKKRDLQNTLVSPVHKTVDIKVKVNNVPTSSTNSPSSAIILPQERIIISLNNDSSSDDSDQEDNTKTEQSDPKSAVASLEALILNARNESDGKKSSIGSSNSPSDALSWLSKAQQEEYNSLIKILAKKQEFSVSSPLDEVKKTTEDAGLALLKKKMFIARKNYEKEKELMNSTAKELLKKKRAYMSSKLKTQHLKEQLLAAERVRKSNLQLWNKCSKEYQTLKNSVSKRQTIMRSLQTKISSYLPEHNLNGLSPLSNSTPEQDNLNLV